MEKLKDYRLGNKIYGSSDRIETITGISDDGTIKSYPGKFKKVKCSQNIEFCSPIPLSEELFIKLGFIKNKFNDLRFDFDDVDNNQFHLDQLNNRFVFRGLGMSIVYVDYLHDLQNIYFACKRSELNVSGIV